MKYNSFKFHAYRKVSFYLQSVFVVLYNIILQVLVIVVLKASTTSKGCCWPIFFVVYIYEFNII